MTPTSLSFPEAMSSSSLPISSQVMLPGWEETWERASMTTAPMEPDYWQVIKCILSSGSLQNWQVGSW